MISKHCISAAALLVLTACSGETVDTIPKTESGQVFAFVTELPGAPTFKEKYNINVNTTSPIPAYHFQIGVPKEWIAANYSVKVEPEPGAFYEMGVYRIPGPWQTNKNAFPSAEIGVTVVNLEGDSRSAEEWLKAIIEKNLPNAQLREEKTIDTPSGKALDILLRYNDSSGTVINRMAAFRDGDKLYLISGSDNVNGYRDTAEAMYVAIVTFEIKGKLDANPFKVALPASLPAQ